MELSQAIALRVVPYVRVSTEEQRQGQNIDSQIEELQRFAVHKDWRVVGIYKDDGWTGSVLGRPGLDRLRDDAAKGLFDAVLVNDVDRLARDVTHLGVIKRGLARHGVAVIFRKLPAENTPTNNLLVNILGSFAEFERELIADRTRRGRRYKVETRKLFLGCLASYGFDYTPRTRSASGEGELQLAPSEVAVVKEIYRWVDVDGLSARQVVARLNHEKLRPRNSLRPWQKSSVLRILRNEMYTGVWHYNKHEYRRCDTEHSVTPARSRPQGTLRRRLRSEWIAVPLPRELHIIERAQWERVQRQLDRNRAFSARHSRHEYLLRGLVKCGACSSAYVGDPCHGRFYYRCAARCRQLRTISEDLLNGAVWKAISDVVLNPALVTDRIRVILERRRASADRITDESREIDEAIADLELEEGRLVEGYRTGILSAPILGRELETLSARRTALAARQATVSSVRSALPAEELPASVEQFLRGAAMRLSRFTTSERQRFLRLIVCRIVFEGERARIIARIPGGDELPKADSFGPPSIGSTEAAPGIMPAHSSSDAGASFVSPVVSCRIATTGIAHHGRNPAVELELVAALPRPRSTARTLSDRSVHTSSR